MTMEAELTSSFILKWQVQRIIARSLHCRQVDYIGDACNITLTSAAASTNHVWTLFDNFSLFDLNFTSKSTLFQFCRDGFSWAEPVLSSCKAQGHNAVTPLMLEPATPRSRVKDHFYSTRSTPRTATKTSKTGHF